MTFQLIIKQHNRVTLITWNKHQIVLNYYSFYFVQIYQETYHLLCLYQRKQILFQGVKEVRRINDPL